MNSPFLKELYEKTDGYPMLLKRFEELDVVLKDFLCRDSLKEDILRAMDTINLTHEYYTPVARNIAFYLLQIMEPKDLREELVKDMPSVRKEVIDALIEKVRELIVGKEIASLIQNNWDEDDKEADEVAEEIELAKVPLPPGASVVEEMAPIKAQPAAELMANQPPENMPIPSWEEKIAQTAKASPKIETRQKSDQSLPKISVNGSDPYREMPE